MECRNKGKNEELQKLKEDVKILKTRNSILEDVLIKNVNENFSKIVNLEYKVFEIEKELEEQDKRYRNFAKFTDKRLRRKMNTPTLDWYIYFGILITISAFIGCALPLLFF